MIKYKLTAAILMPALCLFIISDIVAKENEMVFKKCPDSPNCVSSMEPNTEKFIEPIDYSGIEKDRARKILLDILESDSSVKIDVNNGDYIHTVFTTLIMRFKDDVEFFFPADKNIIHIKSASRVGYSDMGKNRKRLNELKKKFYKKVKSND